MNRMSTDMIDTAAEVYRTRAAALFSFLLRNTGIGNLTRNTVAGYGTPIVHEKNNEGHLASPQVFV